MDTQQLVTILSCELAETALERDTAREQVHSLSAYAQHLYNLLQEHGIGLEAPAGTPIPGVPGFVSGPAEIVDE
jgi:hypothetical protein